MDESSRKDSKCRLPWDPRKILEWGLVGVARVTGFVDSALVIHFRFEKLAEENHWGLQGLAAQAEETSTWLTASAIRG